jgi:hypothetical protein
VGNNLRAVSGTIVTREPITVSGTIISRDGESRDLDRRGGPRYPRPHLQKIEIDLARR